MLKIIYALGFSSYVLVITTRNAHAYLDPGSASMILQTVLGGLVAGFVAIRLYWGKFKAIFRRDKKEIEVQN